MSHRWLRDAIRSRLLVSLLLLAVAGVAVTAAVLGPLLVRATQQFTVKQAVEHAGADSTAIRVELDFDGAEVEPFLQSGQEVLEAATAGNGASLWGTPEVWSQATSRLAWGAASANRNVSSAVRLAGTDCQGMVFVTGRCPTAAGEVVTAAADAKGLGLRVGSRVVLRPPSTTIGPGTPPAAATIVGTYDPSHSGVPRTEPVGAGDAAGLGSPIVITAPQATALALSTQILGRIDLLGGLRAGDEAAARSSIAAANAAVLTESRSVTVTSGLPALLDQVDAQVRSATILVLVTEIQALAVGVFALAVVLQRIAVARAGEWGIGRLRGVPKRRWFVSIYAEPAIALVLGCVLGFVAGPLIATVSVRASLGAGVGVEPWRRPVVAAGLAVMVALIAALVLVSAPSQRRPLVELIQQRSESRRLGVAAAVAQSAVVLLAAATIYQLRTGGVLDGGGSQLGLLAPALLALTLAIGAVRLAVVVVRRVTARPPRSLVGLVVGRQAARTPSSLNTAVVVAVGMALAVFASQIAVVSARNQELRAVETVGAASVLTVDVPAGRDLRALVDAADPSGRSAMAAQERSGSDEAGVGRVLAVDSSRLNRVARASPFAVSSTEVAALRPAGPAAVTVRGRSISVTLTGVEVHRGVVDSAGGRPADPHLQVTVQTSTGWQVVDLGSVGGALPLHATVPCSGGCRLVSVGTESDAGAAYTAELTVAGVSTDQQTAKTWQPLLAASWHPRVGDRLTASPRVTATPTPGPTGLTLAVDDLDGGNAAVVLPPDAVDPLPALVAPATDDVPFAGIEGAALGRGLDGAPQLIQVVGRPVVVPRLLREGVVVDLDLAGKLADPSRGSRTNEVWLSSDAPPTIEQALTAQGLIITGRDLLTARARELSEQPSTRAAVWSRYLGLAALALTLLALVAAQAADASRRRPDWKSLVDGGLERRTVFGLAFVEIGLPVALGVLLGAASGAAGFALAASRLPLVDLTSPGPPLDLHVDWVSAGTLAVGGIAVVLAVAAITARLETRSRREHRG